MKGGCSPQNSLHLREAGSVWQTFFFESAKYFWQIGPSLQNPWLAFEKKAAATHRFTARRRRFDDFCYQILARWSAGRTMAEPSGSPKAF